MTDMLIAISVQLGESLDRLELFDIFLHHPQIQIQRINPRMDLWSCLPRKPLMN